VGKLNKIAEPHKELRFTRARQAMTFLFLGLAFVMAAIFLWVKATPIVGNAAGDEPLIRSHLWGFVPLLVAIWCFWVAAHCARHAFLILTPLGIEIFPFWFPSKNMQVVYWTEVATAHVSEDSKTLTIDREGGGGAVVSLAPVSAKQRPLLKRAVEGRIASAA
jgi:hypothetical protein